MSTTKSIARACTLARAVAEVFIRSMSTLGATGGLAPATHDAALVLDAAGFDAILLETVGVGLDEAGVAELRQRYAERALGRLDADVVEAAARRVAGRECDPYTIIEGWLRV